MSDWEPPQSIETIYEKTSSMGGMNRPTSGKRSEEELPIGSAHFQLYSLATPNGQKIGILLEELDIPYDAHVINIGRLQQFTKGFVGVNPNSKIPAAMDHAPVDGGHPLRLFESGAMMLYLAEKYGKFFPQNPRKRAECMNWVMWQMAPLNPSVLKSSESKLELQATRLR
jgi:GSH-dependent disulfide-bond oxidoreductase